MRERLFSELPEKVIRYLFEPAIENAMERSFQNIMDVNKAHLSMLMSEGIVSETAGHTIMQALIEIQAAGVEQLDLEHHLEDLYFKIEQGLIDKVGIEVAGQLSIGRSRDDFDAVVIRMNSRDGLQKICKLVLKLRTILIELADDYCDLDLSGYIHMQSLEPMTLGNYFSATLHVLERDFIRIQKALQQSNVSPLGLGGMAGTAFSIYRDKVARLLGFTDTMKNSLDGIASCDYILESLSAMNIFMSHLNRLSYDLYMLSRDEYGIVEFGDADTAPDGMAHKEKSLMTAEHIKAKSSHVLAALVSATHIPYGHYWGMAGESTKYFWGALKEVESAVELLLEAMQAMEFKEPAMLERASDHFSIVTELTDMLVGEARISQRRAHQLIGHLINHIFQHQMSFKQLDAKLIEQLSIEMFGKRISVPQEKIENVLRSVTKVEAKKVQSGSASREVKNQLERLKHKLLQDENWLAQQVQRNLWSKDKLKNNLRQTP